MLCIPAIRIIIVNPEANQITMTQMAVSANPVLAVQGVLTPTMWSLESRTLIVPKPGCSSTSMRKLSVLMPTMNGRKKQVRNRVVQRRFDRVNTASKYPTTRIGTVTMAVYSRVNTIEWMNVEL